MDSLFRFDLPTYTALKEEMGLEFFPTLVETFCSDLRIQIEALGQALDKGDSTLFTRLAHTIKSTSLTMGALEFGNLARELELLGREERLTEVPGKFRLLSESCEPLLQELRMLSNE